MIDIWKYNVGDRVKIIADNNAVFIGRIDSLIEAEECSDLEKQEDNIGITTDDGKYIDIYQSEIKEITKAAEAFIPRNIRLASGK